MPNITPAAALPGPQRCLPDSGQVPPAGRFSQAFAGVHSSATDLRGPYFSAKRDRMLCLNGEARVGNEVMSCRHLSVLWERSFKAGRDGSAGKPDYHHFSSIEALEAHAPRDLPALCIERESADARFVDNADWGNRIGVAFRSMQAAGCAQGTIHLRTPNHAMALGLRIKPSERGPRYVAKFYDPNRTVTHRRAEGGEPEAFAALAAGDFVNAPEMARYRMTADSGPVMFLGARLADHAAQSVSIPRLDGTTLLHLIDLGLAAGIERYGELVRERGLPSDAVADLLAGTSDAGVPGLTIAVTRRFRDAIRKFGDILAHAGLDSATIAGLLAGRTRKGHTSLYVAMHNGHADAVRAWGDVFLRCKLDPRDRVDLLVGPGASGDPALHAALRWNNADAIRAYGDLLFKSVADRRERRRLLGATEDTAASMSDALRSAPRAARDAYYELLRTDAIALP